MARITHITLGHAGLHAASSAELHAMITTLAAAGYTITDVEDNPAEPWHVATIHYTYRPMALRALQDLVRGAAEPPPEAATP